MRPEIRKLAEIYGDDGVTVLQGAVRAYQEHQTGLPVSRIAKKLPEGCDLTLEKVYEILHRFASEEILLKEHFVFFLPDGSNTQIPLTTQKAYLAMACGLLELEGVEYAEFGHRLFPVFEGTDLLLDLDPDKDFQDP